eukprot:TRINITY_DN1749_c0_g1_i2.p2 TRINITY_DN1749_c0_g1~~TRINITY_DN1749_c0_g1_i2.p2  ORF type:complete len:134 (-),score=36.72 TRINITY_DN1749_c0_g1_i2:422-823(-)
MVTFGEPMKIELPLKNTFIHFDGSEEDEEESPTVQRSEKTCPDILQESLFRTKSLLKREEAERKIEMHLSGECRPCAYFAFKRDGCRMGEDCEFCHLCDRAETRRWKRARAKCLKTNGTEDEDFIRIARQQRD